MLVEQRDLEVLAQDVLRAFVLAKYPNEAEYLPVAWQLIQPGESVDVKKIRNQDIQRMGLPFADHRGGGLILPIAMLALWTALLELNDLDTTPPNEQAVRDALQRCCDALGTTTKLSDELLQIAGPMLHRWFAGPAGSKSPGAEPSHGRDSTDCVVVEWLKADGSRSQGPELTPIAKAEGVVQTGHWDIVIKELQGANEVIIQGEDPLDLYQITPMRRGMLWLVLTKVGNCVKEEEIRDFFGTHAEPTAIQQYPSKLRELLGAKLKERVLPRGRSRQYPIPGRGWSFYWIRGSAKQNESKLLFDFDQLPENQNG